MTEVYTSGTGCVNGELFGVSAANCLYLTQTHRINCSAKSKTFIFFQNPCCFRLNLIASVTIRQEGVGMRSFAAYTVELIEDCRRKGSQSETRVITPVQQPIILLPAPGSLPRASYGLRMTIIIRCTYTVAQSGQPLPSSQHNNSPNSVNCTELKSNYAYYRVIAKNVGDPFLWDTV